MRDYLKTHQPRNALNYYRVIRQLFRHAVRIGWLSDDPLRALDPPTWRPVTPAILTPAQVDALLSGYIRLRAYFAIGILAGLRPGEIESLDWSAIDLDGRTILVLPETSKVRRARYVTICPRLLNILRPVARDAGPIVLGERWLRIHRHLACKAAGVVWSQDVMRHTYATMRLAVEPAGMVALDMGTSEQMLMRHYRGLLKCSDASGFFTCK